METFPSIWKNLRWPGGAGDVPDTVTLQSPDLPFSNPQGPPQASPLTAVLHGPAGVGKTTLAKKWMLDWSSGRLPLPPGSAFYLSCKGLNRRAPCSLAELVSGAGPPGQAVPELLAPEQQILFILDGFEELRVPAGALLCDLSGDWRQPQPVPVLLGSLLRRKVLPGAALLVTTRSGALGELRPLVERPLLLEMRGLAEPARRRYFLQHFGEEAQARRAFGLMKSNTELFGLGAAPAVCWLVCTCLQLQLDRGEDPGPTCRTTTGLFLRFLCGQFPPAPGSHPGPSLRAALQAASLLAARGTWAQTSVFDGDDLARLGVKEAELHPLLDKRLLHKDRDCGGCYSFIHLSVQQFFSAMFYALEDGPRGRTAEVQKLLSREERLQNPGLAQVTRFLFGLAGEEPARELETTFGCRVSTKVVREMLKCGSEPSGRHPFSSVMDAKEVFFCLYESQDGQLVQEAMGQVKDISVHLASTPELTQSSFCLKHCQNLQKMSLQVDKGLFLENDADAAAGTGAARSQHDHHTLCLWMDFCSVFSSNQNLSFLEVSQSFLSHSSVRILCEHITHVTCRLQKVVIKNVSPAAAYGDFCLALIGKKTLTHLGLEGGSLGDHRLLVLLGEALKHPRCHLQNLRLGSCSKSPQQQASGSSGRGNARLLDCWDLTAGDLLDEKVKVLCLTLRHPKCFLRKLSLENCHLTEAFCEELSPALLVNQTLTHLCLANNSLGDDGVKRLCEGLSYPECKLQTLVLRDCDITRRGCKYISELLQGDCSLTSLDLGFNPIAAGLCFFCEALKKPSCNLKCLGLQGCSITAFGCQDLAAALVSNLRLETLDLGQNDLRQRGVMVLLEALKQSNGPLKTLRLKLDAPSMEVQALLREVKGSNPWLTVEWSDVGTARSSCCDFLS
ncbi:NACHT, LRR and PYD domains-containing protein 7 [Talpa occidentalis]|uniref:NACHT, LRR and PYD domains-containing protein 7 n=1 Tax=Talpa occidentalis TaxID=50954 RepID=UPI00188F25E3|nr:NACHT, LRR and PYD domains-containing protein 7 [Talpa occidentalis]XP_037379698.1 NACHT, LRR and PYD domains-containing protein 7 [Talpa occidentalis]XP_037379699.1 NACHT, LRR and PYD domains-containing protein 7 [Talpa occidentalis]